MFSSQTIGVEQVMPQQFITQAHSDWDKQMEQLFKSRSTLTKTVILPAGVRLNDQRLAEGIVVSERKYMMPAGVLPEWPEDTPFECDVDGRLLPPCWGKQKLHAHYAIYPNKFFPELNCEHCQRHQQAHPQQSTLSVASASVSGVETLKKELNIEAGPEDFVDAE